MLVVKEALLRLLGFFGQLDVAEGDRRPLAHAPEDASGHVEQVRGRVELGDLACVENAYAIVADDRAQAI